MEHGHDLIWSNSIFIIYSALNKNAFDDQMKFERLVEL